MSLLDAFFGFIFKFSLSEFLYLFLSDRGGACIFKLTWLELFILFVYLLNLIICLNVFIILTLNILS